MSPAPGPHTAELHETATRAPRPFAFDRDTFAFANELIWEYRIDAATGKTLFLRRETKPAYAHRCFVLARAARQFLFHARFDADGPAADDETCRRRIREVLSRNPRVPSEPGREVLFSGYDSLRQFSRARETLLKSECGGAWRSYVLRSHWRMVFPISRRHQSRTAAQLTASLRRRGSPIVHLVKFPRLSINHGMVLFEVAERCDGADFRAYDPNDPDEPALLSFDRSTQSFRLPANRYWAGGGLNVIEIYRSWFL